MKLIPALSVSEGQAVQVSQGEYVLIPADDGDPLTPGDILWNLREAGYTEAYMLDIDGLERNRPNLKLVQSVFKTLPLWLDAGPIIPLAVTDLLVAGADKAVISSRTTRSLGTVKESLEMSPNIIFSIDWDDKILSPNSNISKASPRELAAELKSVGVPGIVFFDFGRISRGTPLRTDIIAELAENFPEVYVAGIMLEEDLAALEDTGAAGAIVDFKLLAAWNAKPAVEGPETDAPPMETPEESEDPTIETSEEFDG